jgi:hypothetical protein
MVLITVVAATLAPVARIDAAVMVFLHVAQRQRQWLERAAAAPATGQQLRRACFCSCVTLPIKLIGRGRQCVPGSSSCSAGWQVVLIATALQLAPRWRGLASCSWLVAAWHALECDTKGSLTNGLHRCRHSSLYLMVCTPRMVSLSLDSTACVQISLAFCPMTSSRTYCVLCRCDSSRCQK